MALEIGNLLGAAANITAAFSKPKSLKSYLSMISDLGVQVTNNFEVNFSGLEDITFFVTTINFDGITVKTDEVYYNGRSIPFPVISDYGHTGQMTIINDGNGYLYSAVQAFITATSNISKLDTGYKMVIKCLTGDPKYKGSTITLNSVFLEKLDGLSFQYQGGDVSTFNVAFNYRDFNFTPGALNKVSGIAGAVNSLIG